MALHEANRVKLAEMMPKGSRGVALLQGGDQQTRYDTDHEPVFRQESYFQYLFGVSEAGCFGAVSLPRSAHACLCTLWTLSAHSGTTLRGSSLHALHPLRTFSAPSSHPLRTLSTVRAPRSSCRSWAKSTKSSVAATPRQRRSRRPTAWRRCMSCPRGLPPPSPLPSSPLTLIFAVTVILALAFTLALTSPSSSPPLSTSPSP